MKILLITDNFPPEVNAPATRGFKHAEKWVKMGYQVTILTCFPNFPKGKVFEGYKNSLYAVEELNGIRIIRLWSYITSNDGFLRRTLDYMSFCISSFVAGLFFKTDIILATSPQFFVALSGHFLSKVKRKPWILEIRDLWPDSISAVGSLNKTSYVFKILKSLEGYLYRSASKLIVVTDSFKKYLIEEHQTPEFKIGVFKNGIDNNLNNDLTIAEIKSLKKSLGMNNDKKVVSYIGTHGLAHGLEFILNSIKSPEFQNFYFLFLGDGAKRRELIKLKSKLNLTNVIFLKSVSKSEVHKYIQISDFALVNLKKSEIFKTVIPSKIFENVAYHKPIILGVEGEAKEIVETYGVGISFEPENMTEFFNAIDGVVKIQHSKEFLSGCERLKNDFDRERIAEGMINFVLSINNK